MRFAWLSGAPQSTPQRIPAVEIIGSLRPTQRHTGFYQNRLVVFCGIVMHYNRRPLGMLICPMLQLVELLRWVLRDNSLWVGCAAGVNVRCDLLIGDDVADAAIDPLSFWFIGIDRYTASLNARPSLRPFRVRVLLPGLCRGHDQGKDRA